MRKGLVLSVALALPVLTGCAAAQHTIKVSPKGDTSKEIDYNSVDYVDTNHFVLYGFLQHSPTDASNVCKNGQQPVKIVSETRWYQSLIAYLTLGIYTPRNTYVICG